MQPVLNEPANPYAPPSESGPVLPVPIIARVSRTLGITTAVLTVPWFLGTYAIYTRLIEVGAALFFLVVLGTPALGLVSLGVAIAALLESKRREGAGRNIAIWGLLLTIAGPPATCLLTVLAVRAIYAIAPW